MGRGAHRRGRAVCRHGDRRLRQRRRACPPAVKQTPVGGCRRLASQRSPASAVDHVRERLRSAPGYRMGFSWATQPGTNTRILRRRRQGYTTRSNAPGRFAVVLRSRMRYQRRPDGARSATGSANPTVARQDACSRLLGGRVTAGSTSELVRAARWRRAAESFGGPSVWVACPKSTCTEFMTLRRRRRRAGRGRSTTSSCPRWRRALSEGHGRRRRRSCSGRNDVRDVRAGVVDPDRRGRPGRAVLQRDEEVRRLRHAHRPDLEQLRGHRRL